MLTLQNSTSIAASVSNPNLLATSRLEFAPSNGKVNIYLTASQLGAFARVLIAGDEVQESSGVSARNAFPLVPDDVIIADIPVDAGEKITIEVNNTAGTATTVFFRVELVQDEMMFAQ